MTISPKALIAVASMAGGCIGVPLCLWRAQSSSMDLSQSLKPLSGTSLTARTTDTPKEKKSVVKGRCDITSFEAGVGDFLTKQHKREGDYKEVICKNSSVEDDGYITLPNTWKGLFPQIILSAQTAGGGSDQKLDISAETKQEEGSLGSVIVAIFSGKGLKDTLKGKWEETDEKLENKRAVSVTIQEGGWKDNVIYLLLPPLTEE